MMKVTLIVITLIVIVFKSFYCLPVTRNNEHLKAIAILIRHGDRNAVPKNPGVKNDWHFDRTGDLTTQGCLRMYIHGRILRQKYPEIAERTSTELRSASVPSPLVVDSLHCLMSGINGPFASLSMMPRDPPVYVPKNRGEDTMLNFGRVDCPLRETTLQKNKTFLALYDKHKGLIDRLNNGTGEKLNASNLMTIIKGRLEPILNAHEVGLAIPDWADESFRNESHHLADEEFEFMVNFEFQRALSGVFFKELISRFNESAKKPGVSFYAFSSVHTTMGPLMKTIDVWTGLRPAYGEALIFTLDQKNQFGVDYLMSNGTIRSYSPAGCQGNCLLADFEQSVSRYTALDWEKECNKPFNETEA